MILPVNLVGSQLGCFFQTLEGQQQLHPHLGEGQSLHLQEEKIHHPLSFYNNLTMDKPIGPAALTLWTDRPASHLLMDRPTVSA